MAWSDRDLRRHFKFAALHHVRATWRKRATGSNRVRGRWLATDRVEALGFRLNACDGPEKSLGIWVCRRLEQGVHVRGFDNLPGVHDCDPVAHLRYDCE